MSEPPTDSRTGPVLVGAIDQGTQSTRFFLFDKECSVVASAQAEVPQHYPKPGWSEHDPLEIWASTQQVIEQACEQARAAVGAFTVAAIGITNQRETTVAWSRETGRPLHNAIVWHDNRTQHICHEMEKELGSRDYFRPVTGLPISTYFSAFKARWLRENVPSVAEALRSGAAMLGTVDSWLIYCLTGGVHGGVHVTDVTNASRTNLMDVRTRRWHRPFLELFGLPLDAMPSIISNAEECGKVAAGPLQGVSISGSLGDQQAALLGHRCRAGDAKNTYGTGCFMLLHTGEVAVDSHHGLLTTLAFQLGRDAPAEYALEGSVAVAGMAVSWLRDSLGILNSAAESEDLARRVEHTGGVYFVPAFSGLLAPHWRDDARGVIVGLSGFTNSCHITRAVLEAICFQTREVLDAMRADASESGCRLAVLRVDGGATANGLLMQLQADLLQAPVVRPAFQETTGLGAALAAGLACGFWDWEQIFSPSQRPANDTTFCPAVPEAQAERRYCCWKTAVQRSLDLADLADNCC